MWDAITPPSKSATTLGRFRHPSPTIYTMLTVLQIRRAAACALSGRRRRRRECCARVFIHSRPPHILVRSRRCLHRETRRQERDTVIKRKREGERERDSQTVVSERVCGGIISHSSVLKERKFFIESRTPPPPPYAKQWTRVCGRDVFTSRMCARRTVWAGVPCVQTADYTYTPPPRDSGMIVIIPI